MLIQRRAGTMAVEVACFLFLSKELTCLDLELSGLALIQSPHFCHSHFLLPWDLQVHLGCFHLLPGIFQGSPKWPSHFYSGPFHCFQSLPVKTLSCQLSTSICKGFAWSLGEHWVVPKCCLTPCTLSSAAASQSFPACLLHKS